MKKLLLFLILTFNFQTLTKADDIRDFEIEGISIGDNALDFFSKEEIDSNKSHYQNSKKIWRYLSKLQNREFESIQLHIKKENSKYVIVGVAGLINFSNKNTSFNKCIEMRSKIVKDLESSLKVTTKSDEERDDIPTDKSGKSYALGIYFDFKDDFSEYVKIACTFYTKDFTKETGWSDYLRLALTSSELHYWLKNEAFK